MKTVKRGLLISLSMATVCWSENIALHRPYTLSAHPGYSYSTDAGDATQLTDGLYVSGYFWTQKGCVGWSGVAPVLITIDLGQRAPIRGVTFNTAAGVAGVNWPEMLYLFVSDDQKTWRFLGDLAALGTVAAQPPATAYGVFKYATEALRGCGRYVCVLAVARPFCFVDEIEVLRGDAAWLTESFAGQTTTNRLDFFRTQCARSGVAARLRADCAALGGDSAWPLKIEAFAQAQTNDLPGILPYGPLHEAILAQHQKNLHAAGFTEPFLWMNNRWDPLTLLALPDRRVAAQGVTVELMKNEVRGEAVTITNPTDTPLELACTLEGFPGAVNIALREVLVTDTQSRQPIASALRPLVAGDRVRVPVGCTRQLWIAVHRPSAQPGLYEGRLVLTSATYRAALPVRVRVSALTFPSQPTLHVGGWDYVQGNADYYRTPGNLTANLALMRDLYVDSPWATSAVFPHGALFDSTGCLTNAAALDFSAWDRWVERWHGARNYCVFFSVGKSFQGEPMGTPRFATRVTTWLRAWVDHLKAQQLAPHQLVILLYDEPHKVEDDAIIVAWATAINRAALGVTLFVDPTYTDPKQGQPEMFAANDILCPHTPMLVQQGEPFRAFYRDWQAKGKTLWLYSCMGPSRLLDPITYHRMQMWIAFQIGAQGSFYWALGCGGGIGNSWQPYAQAHAEYSPYFVSPTTVMESKNSEALREGVQDYEYLVMLRQLLSTTQQSAAWQVQARTLLEEGVQRVVASAQATNLFWNVAKDRSLMDTARIAALHLLEEAKHDK